MHNMAVDAQGVMRMREVEGIVIAPKAAAEDAAPAWAIT